MEVVLAWKQYWTSAMRCTSTTPPAAAQRHHVVAAHVRVMVLLRPYHLAPHAEAGIRVLRQPQAGDLSVSGAPADRRA